MAQDEPLAAGDFRTRFPKGLSQLVEALSSAIDAIDHCAENTKSGIGRHSFISYHTYRKSIDQYAALDMTIRGRAARMGRDDAETLTGILLDRERRFLSATIRASLEFFFALSAISVLPFGTKELFEREREFLHSSADRLRSDDHVGEFADGLQPDLEMAEQILVEIMDKAPSFPDFDMEPAAPAQRALPPPREGQVPDLPQYQ